MRCSLLAVFVSLGILTGCGDSASATKTPPLADPGKTNDGKTNHRGVEIAANLAKLSAADRSLAENQRDCPVSDEPLGSMGVPIKVRVKEQNVWLCGGGCKSKLIADPDKYLAKLK